MKTFYYVFFIFVVLFHFYINWGRSLTIFWEKYHSFHYILFKWKLCDLSQFNLIFFSLAIWLIECHKTFAAHDDISSTWDKSPYLSVCISVPFWKLKSEKKNTKTIILILKSVCCFRFFRYLFWHLTNRWQLSNNLR